MADPVSWTLTLAVKAGELDAFRELMTEMVSHTQGEEGALTYEWFVSDDGGTVHIYERYADSAAVMTHMQGFGAHFAERFMAAVEPTGFYVYGDPSAAVRETLGGMGAQFLAPFGGFSR